MRILQFTDCHLYADRHTRLAGMCTYESLSQVIAKARADKWPPAFVVFTGDLVDDVSGAGYRSLNALLAVLNVPTFCLAGNHDAPSTMAACLQAKNISLSNTAVLENWRFLFLNTHLPNTDAGALGADQMEWLVKMLSGAVEQHALIFLHHPPISVGSAWMDAIGLEDGEELLEKLARFEAVRALAAGHVHQEFDAEQGGLRILTTPSTCVQFTPNSEQYERDHLAPGYRWFELNADGSFETGIERIRVPSV